MTTYYAGLDLHKKYLTVCVLDSLGQVAREQRRLAPTVEAVTALFPAEGTVTVVLEATLQWAWFHDRLTALGHRVLVAHPQQLKVISQARCKTDPIDARKLAELGRVNLVRRSGCRTRRHGSGGGGCGVARGWCAGGRG